VENQYQLRYNISIVELEQLQKYGKKEKTREKWKFQMVSVFKKH